jgi:hypothetical protein
MVQSSRENSFERMLSRVGKSPRVGFSVREGKNGTGWFNFRITITNGKGALI